MQHVVLINPSNRMQDHYVYRKALLHPIPPGNLASLAAVAIQAGHRADVIDQFLERMSNEVLAARIVADRYDLVGITCLTPSDAVIRDLARCLRNKGYAGRIVLGNTHAGNQYESFLGEGTIDAVVHGEGEVTFAEILAALDRGADLEGIDGVSTRRDGKIITGARRALIADLDTLVFPAWECLDTRRYDTHPVLFMYEPTLPVQASRGCKYNCYMCTQDALLKKFRLRSAGSVVAEIQRNIQRHHATGVGFLDSYFPPTTEWGWEFVREVRAAGLAKKFRFCLETRADSVIEDLFRELVAVGCHNVAVGFEAGSDETLRRIGKHTTVADNRRAMGVLRKLGIATTGFFMIGCPWEDEAMVRETIAHALELAPDLVKINIAVPMPGSRFYEDMKARTDVVFDFCEMNPWSGLVTNGVLNQQQEFSLVPYRRLLRHQRVGMLRHYVKPWVWARHLMLGSFRRRTVLPLAAAGFRFLQGLFERRS